MSRRAVGSPWPLCHPRDVRWSEGRPQDANEQLIEFAATGRLVEIDPRARVNAADKSSTVLVLVLTSAALGVGITMLVIAAQSSSVLATIVGFSLVAMSLALLLPTLRLVQLHTPTVGVAPKPGAVLPPELLRAGNWVYRSGAWARIEQVGRDGNGAMTALLSSGEVIDLTTPLTVAGDAFRPTSDPVAALRR